MGISRFRRTYFGDGGTYKCACCGKLTRETGDGESGCELCAYCYHEGGLENSLSDGLIMKEEFEKDIVALRKKYGRDAKGKEVKQSNQKSNAEENIMSKKSAKVNTSKAVTGGLDSKAAAEMEARLNANRAEAAAKEKAAKPAKVKAAPKAKDSKGPRVTVASRMRELIKAGKTNEEVFAIAKKEFKLDDSKKHYPSWYRCEMQRAKQAARKA